MTLLDRYVIRAMLGGILLVMTVLLVLGALLLFVGQQDDIGTGRYSALDAVVFTALNLPQQVYELLPISALIVCASVSPSRRIRPASASKRARR